MVILVVCVMAVTYWAVARGGTAIRIAVVSLALILVACFGYAIGQAWERLRNYDQYIWRFSQYSGYIRGLAERQQIAEQKFKHLEASIVDSTKPINKVVDEILNIVGVA